MDDLRENCPWDKKQTMKSLRHLTIEELYELSDAIIDNNMDEIKQELGDILLHIVFYSRIASETNDFNISNVINDVCDKLIHRHPHIYGNVKVVDELEVKSNWEKLKLKEGKESILEGVPKSLPAIIKSLRIQDKVRGVGFDWDNRWQNWDKVVEEIHELNNEIDKKDSIRIESEFGDVLFALISYSRFLGVNPEDALEKCNRRFIKRFELMEKELKKEEKELSKMSLKEMDKYWELAKEQYLNQIRIDNTK